MGSARRGSTRVALGCLLLAAGCGEPPAPQQGDGLRLGVAEVLAAGEAARAGYAVADRPRSFRFPADHGPHPDFRSEWWYFTGNLRGAGGRRFGYHLTMFRSAVAPDEPQGASQWRTRQVWMAHFAVTDVAGGRMRSAERFARGALGLAGAEARPFAVWLGDWSVRGGGDFAELELRAADDAQGVALALRLRPVDELVLQGEQGLSRKSEAAGNASYYYSLPRLAAEGTVRVDGEELAVTGSGWLDREWSTSALGPEQVGWDWFALQLDDGSELMWYRLRRADGGSDPASAGVFVAPDGEVTRLTRDDVVLDERRHWTSARSGGRYPVAWRLRVPELGLALDVAAVLDDQELDLTFRYWEGAVDVRGRRRDAELRGVGYLEMTGYGG